MDEISAEAPGTPQSVLRHGSLLFRLRFDIQKDLFEVKGNNAFALSVTAGFGAGCVVFAKTTPLLLHTLRDRERVERERYGVHDLFVHVPVPTAHVGASPEYLVGNPLHPEGVPRTEERPCPTVFEPRIFCFSAPFALTILLQNFSTAVRNSSPRKTKDVFTFRIETVVVRVEQGDLRGRKMTSSQGKTYYRFEGIPYAKPPLGPLRFKDPEPPDHWLGVRDALKHGDICIHKDLFTGFVKGSENCLYLNVYTPQLPDKNVDFSGKAVLFWIHGGGFYLGSGNSEIYGPDFIVGEDVILVTFNYRLGPLGFLCTNTEDAPGNAGMKDMVMALKWVKKNIAAFGGDPDRITIFGESAGAASVQYLMLSPLAKGLFQGAISQSGSAACPWAFNPNGVDSSFKLGKAFGIDTKDPKILVESLRQIPAKLIATKQMAALSEQNIRECIPFEFRPCLELETSPDAFLTQNPRKLIEEGKMSSDVPYMAGVNEMEGMILLRSTIDKHSLVSEIDQDFRRTVPRFLELDFGSEECSEVAAKLREFYFKGKPFNKTTYKEYSDLCTDEFFVEGFIVSSRSHVRHMKSPLYNYYFLFEGEFNLFKKLLNIPNIPGPAHADEIFYLFHVPILGQNLDARTREMKMLKKMVRLWTNFAKYGNPTPDQGDEVLEDIVWPCASMQNSQVLNLNDQLTITTGIMHDRVKFWDDLKEQYASKRDNSGN